MGQCGLRAARQLCAQHRLHGDGHHGLLAGASPRRCRQSLQRCQVPLRPPLPRMGPLLLFRGGYRRQRHDRPRLAEVRHGGLDKRHGLQHHEAGRRLSQHQQPLHGQPVIDTGRHGQLQSPLHRQRALAPHGTRLPPPGLAGIWKHRSIDARHGLQHMPRGVLLRG